MKMTQSGLFKCIPAVPLAVHVHLFDEIKKRWGDLLKIRVISAQVLGNLRTVNSFQVFATGSPLE